VLLTARNSDLGEAMNKLLGMQARSTDKAALTDKIRFLKRITPMVAAGFVKLLPVSVLFDPPRETPIFYSDNYFEMHCQPKSLGYFATTPREIST